MATSARRAHGTLLKIGDGGGTEVFTTIAEVLDISGGGYEVQTEDATSHDSAGWYESVPVLKKGQDVTFDLLYYSATIQDTLETDQANLTRRNFTLVMTPATGVTDTRAFAAYIKNVEIQAPVAGVLRMSVTLEVTGAITKTIS